MTTTSIDGDGPTHCMVEFHGTLTRARIRRTYFDGRTEVEFDGGGWMIIPPSMRVEDRHRRNDPATAVAAGRALSHDRLTEMQLTVLRCLDQVGLYGLIDDEYEKMCGLRADSAGKRRLELARKGLVIRTGERRRTRRGAMAEVWRITTAGEHALASSDVWPTAS